MATIVTRAGKGSPLTHNEVDANFTNLNTDKIESGNTVASLNITNARVNQSWDEGTGRLQVTGQTAVEGNVVAQDVIVQGGNNLLQRSQEFDDSYWSKLGSSVTANTVAAPDGTTTAEKLVESAATEQHYATRAFGTIPAGTYTLSFYVKAAERQWVAIGFNNESSKLAWFDLNTGVVGTIQANVSATSIQSVGNGWYRCSITSTTTTTTPYPSVMVASANNVNSYAGNGTSGIYIWGAQLELGNVASPYTPTTSAAVTTTNDVFVPSGQVLAANGTAALPSISNINDTNTGLFNPAADTLAISTGGSERMRVDSSGNVGIGISAPEARLHVAGGNILLNNNQSIRFKNNAGTDESVLGISTANNLGLNSPTAGGNIQFTVRNASNSYQFFISSTEYLRLTSGGLFVGNGDTSATPANGTVSGTNGSGTNITGATLTIQGGRGTGTGAGGPIVFSTSAAGSSGTTLNAATERMRIDSSGNVGIGVTPNTWRTTDKAIQISGGLTGSIFTTATKRISIANNFFISSDGVSRYIATDFASRYDQVNGSHEWYVAPSGTGNTAVTFTQAMTLNASGELSLGNGDTAASPSTGIIKATGGSGTNIAGATLTIQGGRGTGSAAGGPIVFSTAASGAGGTTLNAATERMRIDSLGLVGIGLSLNTLTYRLDVESGLAVAARFARRGDYGQVIAIGRAGVGDAAGFSYPADGVLGFITNASERMRIDGSGNVGIGTTSPTERLHIAGTTALTYARISTTTGANGVQLSNTGGQFYFGIDNNLGSNYATGTPYGRSIFSTDNYPLAFYLNGAERMRITSAGDVGIGTNNPAFSLAISRTGSNPTFALTRTDASVSGSLRFEEGNSGAFITETGNKFIQIATNNTDRVRITAAGNVGIATTSPTAVLDVNSDTIRLRTAKTPASATAAGNQGDICWDTDYIYICTATNTWKRVAIATW